MAAVVWLILGIVLIIAEVLSGDFVLIMLGGGALAAALSSALRRIPARRRAGLRRGLGGPAAGSQAGAAQAAAPLGAARAHGVEALVGGPAVAVSRVDSHGGQVKIGGEIWSARSYDHGQVIEPGERVTVMEISGATAVVLSQA